MQAMIVPGFRIPAKLILQPENHRRRVRSPNSPARARTRPSVSGAFVVRGAIPTLCVASVITMPKPDKTLVFLIDNFLLPTLTIPQLYRCRWQIELFFRSIKRHLRIKKFDGGSPNAIKTQISIAISVYMLLAIIRKRLRLDLSLHSTSQILSVTSREKMPISQALLRFDASTESVCSRNQLPLFNFDQTVAKHHISLFVRDSCWLYKST